MALDVDGIGFIAYVLGKLAGLVGLHPSAPTLEVLGIVLLALLIIGLVLVIVPGYVWGMRKIMADIQSRHGPTRVGPFGLLQTLADGLKLMTKEDVVPARADKFGFALAPYVMIVPVLLAFAPLPWSGGVILANVGAGILLILAIGAISPLGEVLAGWSSNNKYSLYGGLRAAAMDVSYEVPMVISAVAVVLLAGTLNTQGIVAAQQPWWFFVLQPLGVVIFFASAIAKIGVVPLDLPEAESELVAGYFTEYSGMRFGVFFLALFANIFLMSAITVTLFFGGWALLPPFGVAAVTLAFAAVLLTRQPGTRTNVAPPALMGIFVGVLLTYFLEPMKGIGGALLQGVYGGDVATHFLGPGAAPGNYVQTFVAAWEFLVPASVTAALVSVAFVRIEGGPNRDAAVFPLVCIAAILLPPVAMLGLAPFLAVGTAGGILNFVVGGLKMLLLPIVPVIAILVLLLLVGALALALARLLQDPVLGAALALSPALVPLMLIPLGSFLLKTLFFSFMVFWLWFTLPRVRVDQFLRIGWKTMFPLSLVTLVLAGFEAWLLRGGAL